MLDLIQSLEQLIFSYFASIESTKRYTNKNSMDETLHSLELTKNDVRFSKPGCSYDIRNEVGEENEESPTSLLSKGGQLKESTVPAADCVDNNQSLEIDIDLAHAKLIPLEPPNKLSNVDLNLEEKTSSSIELVAKASKSEEDNEFGISALRQRKQEERRERRERIASQVREMKRKQEASESWQEWKRSLFSPFNIGIGVGIGLLLIGGGVIAYVHYSNKI